MLGIRNTSKLLRNFVVLAVNRHSARLEHKPAAQHCLDVSPLKNSDTSKNDPFKTMMEELQQIPTPTPLDEIVTSEENKDYHPAEFIDDLRPPLPISFNLAAYVNHSETLVKLVQLGVDLSQFDIDPKKAKYVLNLDFEKDIKGHIQFLHDHGVPSDMLGRFITKNPFIFQEDIENLEIRINYFESKKFSSEAIAKIITVNPLILSTTTKAVDSCLGFLQTQFSLTGDEVRSIITKCPKLVTYKREKVLEKIFITKEVFGFSVEERKQLLIKLPKVWMLGPRVLKERFDLAHNVMGIPHERIVEFPGVLLLRTFKLKERHEYLVHLNRAQYDPRKPNFISLFDISTTTDNVFCEKCAKTSLLQFNEFLKTR